MRYKLTARPSALQHDAHAQDLAIAGILIGMNHDSLHRGPAPASGSPPAAAPAIDRKILTQLLEDIGGDTTALAGLLRAYLDDTPRLLQEMGQAVADSDTAALSLAAHTLKSTSASLGATALAAMCEELGHKLRSGAAVDRSAHFARIAKEFERGRVLLAAPPSSPDEDIDVAAVLRRLG